jgi:hypothetical protein
MTLFIIIRRVSSLGLTCFDGFLAGVILITNTPIIMSCVIIGNYVSRLQQQADFMMKNIYCDMHQPTLQLPIREVPEKRNMCL